MWDQDFYPTNQDEAPSIDDQQCYQRLEDDSRFKQLQGRLRGDPTHLKIYIEKMNTYVASGYVRKMIQEEADNLHPRTYIPDFLKL